MLVCIYAFTGRYCLAVLTVACTENST